MPGSHQWSLIYSAAAPGPVYAAPAHVESGGIVQGPQQCGPVFLADAPTASDGIALGPRHGRPDYTAQLLSISEQMEATGASNVRVADILLPPNLNIDASHQLTDTQEDARVIWNSWNSGSQ